LLLLLLLVNEYYLLQNEPADVPHRRRPPMNEPVHSQFVSSVEKRTLKRKLVRARR